MDWASLGLAAATASTSGINLYATVLTLGLLQRFNWLQLPGEWGGLGETWILALAAVLFVIEFFADKIPYIDSIWDGIHTFIRIPAGGLLAASAFADLDPGTRLAAGLVGGSLALTTHSAKATARLAANVSPEPFSNIILSVVEDVVAVSLLGLAATHPWLAALALGILLSLCIAIIAILFKFTKKLFSRSRDILLTKYSPVLGDQSEPRP